MSVSVVSPYMFRSYTWPSSGDVACTMLLSALLLRHYFTWVCGRIFCLCCCHVYISAVYRQQRGTYDNNTDRNTATYPSKIVTKQQGTKQHCTRNIPWRWSSVWPKHVGWHNRCRHSNVLKSDCVLMCILKHSAWAGFLNRVVCSYIQSRAAYIPLSCYVFIWFKLRGNYYSLNSVIQYNKKYNHATQTKSVAGLCFVRLCHLPNNF